MADFTLLVTRHQYNNYKQLPHPSRILWHGGVAPEVPEEVWVSMMSFLSFPQKSPPLPLPKDNCAVRLVSGIFMWHEGGGENGSRSPRILSDDRSFWVGGGHLWSGGLRRPSGTGDYVTVRISPTLEYFSDPPRMGEGSDNWHCQKGERGFFCFFYFDIKCI